MGFAQFYHKNAPRFWSIILFMRIWISRLLIASVTVWNLQAAAAFMLSPQSFVQAYELSGAAGEAAVRGVGLLFLMWNIPYLFAAVHPVRHRFALSMALLTQSIGLIGESLILSTLSVDHAILRISILRFIVFDGAGLLLLLTAWFLSRE